MGKERMVLPDKRKMRNLVQYKDMTDEEFDAAMGDMRSEERRVGKEWRSRWSPYT